MKKGKGMDINHHITEQLTFAGPAMYKALAEFWNQAYSSRTIPFPVKKSLVHFSLKPKKPPEEPNSYRTLSQVTKIYEVGELLMWNRTRHHYQSNLNPAHMGFIPGSGTANGQLLAQEVLTDAKEEGNFLILQALDASKAFDGVSHVINQVKQFHHGIQDLSLLMIQEQYKNQSKVVRWGGKDSDPIIIEQGVAQGAHNSPPQYIIHNNSNLNSLDNHSNGYHIGHIKITNDTLADDELLISSSHSDAQLQLEIISIENSRDRSIIQAEKP